MNIKKYILAIDPGPIKSGYIFLSLFENNSFEILDKNHIENDIMKKIILNKYIKYTNIDTVIETIVTYGNKMSQDTIKTAIWAGRFFQIVKDINRKSIFISRPEVKMNLCKDSRAKKPNMKQAIKDRFGNFGTKKNPGKLYELKLGLEKGMLEHIWASFQLAVTYIDLNYGELKL
jgi:hypothetical protein